MAGQDSPPREKESSALPNIDHAWVRLGGDVEPRFRIAVKQQAVEDGLNFAENIFKEVVNTRRDKDPHELVGKPIFDLLSEVGALRQKSRKFKTLVGVRGVTGAGKSSLLNCLLGMSILPVSSAEAATATACHVSWNYDDAPQNAFKGEAIFRSVQDVAQELDEILTAIRRRKELRGQATFEEGDDEEEDELTYTIAEGIKKWRVVWPLNESELEKKKDISAQDIIKSNSGAATRLGKTATITAPTADEFATKIKPYMDTSRTPDLQVIWPLVQEVKIYVKASLLKDGIELVDLPGASDTVSSRAKVAEGYSDKMDLALIVLPAHRAADENTGVTLMTKYQEIGMQMAGKFHKGGFCAVVSKIDGDLYFDDYVKGSPEAKKDAVLQKLIKDQKAYARSFAEMKKKVSEERKELDLARKELGRNEEKRKEIQKESSKLKGLRGEQRKEKSDSLKPVRNQNTRERKVHAREEVAILKSIKSLEVQRDQISSKIMNLDGSKIWRCIWLRNKFIKKRIQNDFAARQEGMAKVTGQQCQDMGKVEVFPVSSVAYQECLKKRVKPGAPIPSELHTGIPRLKQWIEESTFEAREKHLDSILLSLRRIFNDVSRWCDEQATEKLQFSRIEVDGIIQRSGANFKHQIAENFRLLGDNIKELVDFGKNEVKTAQIDRLAQKVAVRWIRKYPEEDYVPLEMNYRTHYAILMRNGGPYTSKGTEKITYDWPPKLATPLLSVILREWTKVFSKEIPELSIRVGTQVMKLWAQYLHEIRQHIMEIAPNLAQPFKELYGPLDSIGVEFCNRLNTVVGQVRKSSLTTREVFNDNLREHLGLIFRQDVKMKGRGSFNNRKTHINAEVQRQCPIIFATAWETMTRARRQCVRDRLTAIKEIPDNMFTAAEIKLSILLDNLDANMEEDQDTLDESARLKKNVTGLVLEWKARWQRPSTNAELTKSDNLDIPEEYYENVAQYDEDAGEESAMSEGDD